MIKSTDMQDLVVIKTKDGYFRGVQHGEVFMTHDIENAVKFKNRAAVKRVLGKYSGFENIISAFSNTMIEYVDVLWITHSRVYGEFDDVPF